MWALSLPVARPLLHELRLATAWRSAPAIAIDSGTVTSAITASSGEIQNIITSTPTTVSTEVMSCDSVCWSVCATLSMSLVTRLSSSPRGWESKYLSGSRDSFASTSCAHRVDGPLHDDRR